MQAKNKKTILLVEDDILLAKVEQQNLEKYGYTVLSSNSGEHAVQTVETRADIDLILMDIDLGDGIDGTEAAARILKNRDLPLVFLSSHTEPEIVEKTEKISSYGYVVKNSTITVLDASIKMAFKLFDANKKTEESEEYFRHSFDYAALGMCLMGTDGSIQRINAAFRNIVGYPDGELLKLNIEDLTHDGDKADSLKFRKAMLDGEFDQATQEKRFIKKDGTVIWVSASTSLIKPNKGTRHFISQVRDITESRKEEKALRVSENRYRNLLYSLPTLAVQGYGMDYVTTYWNKTSEKLYGYTAEEAVGRSLLDLIIPDEMKEGVKEAINQMAETGVPIPEGELSLMKKDGSRIDVLSSHALLTLPGHKSELFCIDIDISERKKAEKSLRESEEKFRTVANFTLDSEYWIGPEGNLIYQSPSIEWITGYPTDSFINGHPHFFDSIIHPDDKRAHFTAHYDAYIKDGGSTAVLIHEFRILTKDGKTKWLEGISRKVFDAEGRYLGIRGSSRDITERRAAEDKIRTLLAEKELILTEVHHRIKNNMNAIHGLLLMQARKLKDSGAGTALEDAGRRVRSMMLLYEKLYTSKNFTEMPADAYIAPLIDEIAANFPLSIPLRISKRIENFNLDAKRLQLLGIIINELLTNISKHAFSGKNEGEVDISLSCGDNRVGLSVGDNGNGLPPTVGPENSTGLGLALVNGLASQLNGTVRIEREAGTKIVLEFAK